jgi:hypothetical protein
LGDWLRRRCFRAEGHRRALRRFDRSKMGPPGVAR